MVIAINNNKVFLRVSKVYDECSLSFKLFKLQLELFQISDNGEEVEVVAKKMMEISTYKQMYVYLVESMDGKYDLLNFK